MRLREYLDPATEKDIDKLLLQMKEYFYLDNKLSTPIEENPQYEYINSNIIPRVKKRTLLFIIKYICRKNIYKAYFAKCIYRNNEITGFVSYIDNDYFLKDLIVLSFEEEESREKEAIIYYLFYLFREKLEKESKIIVEICNNDSKTDYYCSKTLKMNNFYYKHFYNDETNRWNYIITRTQSKLNSSIKTIIPVLDQTPK